MQGKNYTYELCKPSSYDSWQKLVLCIFSFIPWDLKESQMSGVMNQRLGICFAELQDMDKWCGWWSPVVQPRLLCGVASFCSRSPWCILERATSHQTLLSELEQRTEGRSLTGAFIYSGVHWKMAYCLSCDSLCLCIVFHINLSSA